MRAVWDRAVNASLTPAGAAMFTLDEATALVFAADQAMSGQLAD